MASRRTSLFALVCVFVVFSAALAAVVERTFSVSSAAAAARRKPPWPDLSRRRLQVGELVVRRLCEERAVVVVNGSLPGPTIHAFEGDTVVVHVLNQSPHNLTVHWHGVFQRGSAWADGPAYVTQCPIRPGQSYTYRFDLVGQRGTLWWHAHASWLRATVYGALIVRPARPDPFPAPWSEVPILLGEWWNADVVAVDRAAQLSGGLPNISDAFTINGKLGDNYPCSDMYQLTVAPGKLYLLRIINAALNNQLFFKIAGHRFTVVAVDANYVNAYVTDLVVVAPGQTVDALLAADAAPGSYYMAALPYESAGGVDFDATVATGLVKYEAAPPSARPVAAALPRFNDTAAAFRFYAALTGLNGSRPVPTAVHEKMLVAFGLGLVPCADGHLCGGILGESLAGSMNNVSLKLPSETSLLEARYRGAEGVYTADFPDRPPREFDYASPDLTYNLALARTKRETRVKKLKYNSTVEVVLQKTSLLALQSHPIHLHGYDLFVLAQGFGTYDAAQAAKKLNLVNPPVRNTVAVPPGGWAVIRFVADNPGIWLMHCHLDVHSSWGMAMAFEVADGPTPSSRLPPPPSDLPRC
ncbi:laccase-7-like [Wolffia australiana]